MPPGPFNPDIMPVTAKYRWDDTNSKWKVFASRYIVVGASGRKYEQMRETFDGYAEALTAVSFFFGNG